MRNEKLKCQANYAAENIKIDEFDATTMLIFMKMDRERLSAQNF